MTSVSTTGKALGFLANDRWDDAVELVATAADTDPLAAVIAHIARGLSAEKEGDGFTAREHIDQAFGMGLPLPELHRMIGRFYKRNKDYGKAYQCFALFESISGGGVPEFMRGLPSKVSARFAPSMVRRLLQGSRPNLYGLQPIKASLASYLGPEQGAAIYAQVAGIELGGIRDLEVAALRDFARATGTGYEELAPSRELSLRPPPAFGEPDPLPFTTRTRAFYRCKLPKVIVSSKSNAILTDESAMFDIEPQERALYPLDLDVDPVVFAPESGRARVIIQRDALHKPALPAALSLMGMHSYNFGHWLLEFLPRVWAMSDLPGFSELPILIDRQMHPGLRSALETFVDQPQRIITVPPGKAIAVDQLWTCSMPLYFPPGPKPVVSENEQPLPIDGQLYAGLLRSQAPRLDLVPRSPHRRIYLSRQDSQHRRLVNRSEVEGYMSDRGFVVYDPGDLAFPEQLSRIRGAEMIVGPDGSGMWLSFMAQPGAKVVYLNNPFLEEHWWIKALHDALGHEMWVLPGPVTEYNRNYRKFSNYRIDLETLAVLVDELMPS